VQMKKSLLQELLTEGIVRRTSQTDRRVNGAIDRLAETLANSRTKHGPPLNMISVVSTRLNYLEHLFRDNRGSRESVDDTLNRYISFLGITPEYENSFKRTMVFIAKEYASRVSYRSSNLLRSTPESNAEAVEAQEWHQQMLKRLRKKYEAYKDLTEGIVRRTSQHEKRTEAAINVIGKALSATFKHTHPRPRAKRLDNFEDTLVTLAAFLEVPSNHYGGGLDWFFQNRFDELRIQPKDRPPYSPHFQNALIYLAQRYNTIESEDEDNVQEWYYDVVDQIETKMHERGYTLELTRK